MGVLVSFDSDSVVLAPSCSYPANHSDSRQMSWISCPKMILLHDLIVPISDLHRKAFTVKVRLSGSEIKRSYEELPHTLPNAVYFLTYLIVIPVQAY